MHPIVCVIGAIGTLEPRGEPLEAPEKGPDPYRATGDGSGSDMVPQGTSTRAWAALELAWQAWDGLVAFRGGVCVGWANAMCGRAGIGDRGYEMASRLSMGVNETICFSLGHLLNEGGREMERGW